ncbi:phosphomannomutase [Mycolicibacterium aromaticivorans JS19b1 = JCM 16368]|uniref:Phosphomannomutase n=1 Tax=Mycolicibacterium aromaticivorans JS19b1 = JCM 16368 TaxID=1440774 RepID=A0A064CIQ9_9MYCO|nr:phospho-sugar mutase [Mycolicibacterium aromaticivorans]KDE98667.1 phosphomannomutase [Mycolicibacterium aromaticivorans JS19b1 = JCM 16368]
MTEEDWIAHDPDPVTAAELAALDPGERAARFARPLTFGTAGLRGPVRGGPDSMNLAVVVRATWAVSRVLTERGFGGSTVVVGRDARHGSAQFASATAEVFAAQGFSVITWENPVPTPVVAFAVRHLGAAAGVQITASHNPRTDNGYKVYFEGGLQIVSPADREIEAAITTAPAADEIPRRPVHTADDTLVDAYVARAATVRRSANGSPRVALTAMHGVGGELALRALHAAGFDDVHTVASQFAPDPDFPTVAFPNPEEPGTADALLQLAGDVGADIAIALDPDADRCAVGIPAPDGWRMLSGDETGWLLGDYILSTLDSADTATSVVASSVVSSALLGKIAADHGARHVVTLTGFKWLARADAGLTGCSLVYAYEEAIGHCVDPAAVRDKDGISAAVLACDLVAHVAAQGMSLTDTLDLLARRHGVHTTAALSRRVADADEAAAMMNRLRQDPPAELAGFAVSATVDGDAVFLTGGDRQTTVRVVVRPSGTEPKVKCYTEVGEAVGADLAAARRRAAALQQRLLASARSW